MKSIKSYSYFSDDDDDDNIIRLDHNESCSNLEREKVMMMKGALKKVPFNRYPDNSNEKIRELYADYVGVINKDNVLAGNGSDEMIGLVIGTLISPGKKVLMFSRDFSMYEYYVSVYGGQIIKYETEEDGKVDVEKFIELGKKEKVDFVIFSNPNNPTGNVIHNKEIERILEAFENIYVLVDEAYYEFYGESIIDYVDKYRNLLVTRTLSKAWGLAALRIGFLLASKENILKFKTVKIPYTISEISKIIAEEVLRDKNIVKEGSNNIIVQRNKLYHDLKYVEKEAAMEVKFYPSYGNFIFGRTPYKEALLTGLKMHKIVIRNYMDDTFRITVGSDFQNNRVVESMKEIFMYGGE